MYQRVGKAAYKADLSNTLKLAAYLEHPEMAFKSIHVAGTNGKGSCSHMLASVLQEAGYRVGLYTSPHLKDFRERIKIDGEMISKRSVSGFISKHQPFFKANKLSFFEMTVGLAFDYFRSKNVDIAIIEVGLGGRLDSTNVIYPEVSVITNIGLDHTQFLGTTLSQIATEKGGIMKANIPVVIGETSSETKKVFLALAKEKSAPILFAEETEIDLYLSDLKGTYQNANQKTIRCVLTALVEKGWIIPEEAIRKGLQKVVKHTGLLGRWQVLQESPKVICDTAHNKEGLTLTLSQLHSEPYGALHIVLGVVSDKDLGRILPLFPKQAVYYFCAPKISRALDVMVLKKEAATYQLKGKTYDSVVKAFNAAVSSAGKRDVIYVGGSTFVVAEVL